MSILPPLPSEEHRRLVCGDDWQEFLEIGSSMAGMLRKLGYLSAGARLLDIGCGCGRLARHLLGESLDSYRGFDRHPGMIDWCRSSISPLDPRFSFDYFPIRSAYDAVDGQIGTFDAEAFQFPYPDQGFDSIVAASVFTHMAIEGVAGYLRNIRRVMHPLGKALVSVFFVEGTETQSDGVGFYLPRPLFERIVAESGLAARPLFELHVGPVHNWYWLDHARR